MTPQAQPTDHHRAGLDDGRDPFRALRAAGRYQPVVLRLLTALPDPPAEPTQPRLFARPSDAPGTRVRGLARVPVLELVSRDATGGVVVAEVHVRRQVDHPLSQPENIYVHHDPNRPIPVAYQAAEPWLEAVLAQHHDRTGTLTDRPKLELT